MNKIIILDRLREAFASVKKYIDSMLSKFITATTEAIEEVNTRIDEIELTPGPQGLPGNPGANGKDGAAATITIGTVTTGEAGTSAKVVNSGTANAAKLNFTIPKGAAGANGKDGANGIRGSKWFSGKDMWGTVTLYDYFSYSGASDVHVDDYYLNTDDGYVYRCVIAGNGTNAKWEYKGCLAYSNIDCGVF